MKWQENCYIRAREYNLKHVKECKFGESGKLEVEIDDLDHFDCRCVIMTAIIVQLSTMETWKGKAMGIE